MKQNKTAAAKTPPLPRIFVQIASYRDPDCQWTVKDLFEKATHPERIFVGICWQFVKEADAICFAVPYPRPDQVRVFEVDAAQSKGACWARMQTQKLWRGEEFTLQIDSHMRFEPGWDEMLLAMWQECGNEKAILSCYPPGFTPPNDCQREWIFGIGAKEFSADGILYLSGRPAFQVGTDEQPTKPILGAFIAAGALFGPSRMIEDVPFDPYLYFFGEEISVAVRLWTHGYDLFHPYQLVIFHDWDRGKRPTHFSDHRDWSVQDQRATARVRHLLGMETSVDPLVVENIAQYGLGNVRTLAQYQAYSGVDFANRTFASFTAAGDFSGKKLSAAAPLHISGGHVGKHMPKKVFESKQAIVFDDFLPEDLYEKIYTFALKTDYERINTSGKTSRAWHVQDGFPLRSLLNEFYYAHGVEKPTGDYVYPTKTDMDRFVEALLDIQPQVEHLIGKQAVDWSHVSATCWIYPPGTGLAMHDDGAGVYAGAFAYFLNPTWRTHWGGLNLMIEDEGNKLIYDYCKTQDPMDFYERRWLHANALEDLLMEHGFARCIFPKRNRIVFIANDAHHMVTRVNEQAGDNLRMSIAGFFARKKG